MSNDFWAQEPRPSREKGFSDETEEIYKILNNRKDQRIGQLIINAIHSSDEYDFSDLDPKEHSERIHNILWNIEADKLLEVLKEYSNLHLEADN